MRDAAKAVLRVKVIVVNTYIKKQKREQINKLTLYFKEVKKNKLSPKLAEERK